MSVPERNLIIDHLKFSYEGLFNAAELYNIFSTFFYDKGYNWYEKANTEQVTPSGKQIQIILEPWKNVSDYYKIVIKSKINLIDLKDVEVEQDKQTLRLNQGLVKITFDAYVFSDRKGKWSAKPLHWFLALIFEKYFFKEHREKFDVWVKNDVEDLLYKIKSYLNMYKYHHGNLSRKESGN